MVSLLCRWSLCKSIAQYSPLPSPLDRDHAPKTLTHVRLYVLTEASASRKKKRRRRRHREITRPRSQGRRFQEEAPFSLSPSAALVSLCTTSSLPVLPSLFFLSSLFFPPRGRERGGGGGGRRWKRGRKNDIGTFKRKAGGARALPYSHGRLLGLLFQIGSEDRRAGSKRRNDPEVLDGRENSPRFFKCRFCWRNFDGDSDRYKKTEIAKGTYN